MNFYNDIDPNACAWTRELIRMGLIPDGEVHETDLWDIVPEKLMGFTQAHFCNGISVWSYALRRAGWPDDRPCWTASLPCQPFSAAGKGVGLADERHLWPAFFWLVQQCRPVTIFGEQVEAAVRHDWLDHVALSLESIGYTVGAVSTPACSYGAPHERQRVYWVADSGIGTRQWDTGSVLTAQAQRGSQGQHDGDLFVGHSDGRPTRRVADADGFGLGRTPTKPGTEEIRVSQCSGSGNAGILGDSENKRHSSGKDRDRGRQEDEQGRNADIRNQSERPMPTNGFWRNAEWIPCRDGKARPTERGIHPLVGRMEHDELRGCEGGQLRMGGERSESQRATDTGEQEARPTQSSPIEMADGPAAGMVLSGDQGAPADEIDPQNTAEARAMRLRGYGNCIVAEQAIEFIRAYKECADGK